MLAQFCSLTKIFTVLTPKTMKNHQLYASAATKKRRRDKTPVEIVTDGISQRHTSGREKTSLIGIRSPGYLVHAK